MQLKPRLGTPGGKRSLAVTFLALVWTVGSLTPAFAGPREQANRIHDRLAGVPPSATVLADMEADIVAGRALDAAFTALEASEFYSVTLKNFAAPWTNRDFSVFVPLNDYTATVIGMVRDDVPFNTLLSADLVYTGRAGLGLTPYQMTSNAHYAEMEDQGMDLKDVLEGTPQSTVTSLPAAGTAGIMTTRAAAEAFYIAGTNRAMFRFTLLNHLCHDLEEVKDITRVPDRIRQDVSRSPGGDSRIFMNNCIGCHSGMDPLAQALAYYDWDETAETIVYTAGQVAPKYFNNDDVFPFGFVTPDDSWENYWREGQNALLGWDPGRPGIGQGAKTMGEELANSDAFAECQVKKVFRNVCLRDPVDSTDRGQIASMVTSFRATNYSMKQVFAESAVYCSGD